MSIAQPGFDPNPTARKLDHDPWAAVLAPALCGAPEAAIASMLRLERELPLGQRGPLYAASARALAALGRIEQALATVRKAISIGGPEPAAVASIALPEGARWAEARTLSGTAGERADAACDLAWWRLCRGEVEEALVHVEAALALCPEHAEAERWKRFLIEAGPAASTWVDRLPPPGDRRPTALDARCLFPQPELGWLSRERFYRRYTPEARPAAGGAGALGLLRMRGRRTRLLATDDDYAALPADHPLVSAETAFDRVLALLDEERDAGDAAAQAWALARSIDETACADAAQALVGLSLQEPSMLRVGLEVSQYLVVRQPRSALWRAYRARLLAEAGKRRQALGLARAVLADPQVPDLAWLVAIETLRRIGHHRAAHRVVRSALCSPNLGAAAREVLEAWAHPRPVRVAVTDRLRSRLRARVPSKPDSVQVCPLPPGASTRPPARTSPPPIAQAPSWERGR